MNEWVGKEQVKSKPIANWFSGHHTLANFSKNFVTTKNCLAIVSRFSRSAFTYSKLTVESLEQGVKYVQS